MAPVFQPNVERDTVSHTDPEFAGKYIGGSGLAGVAVSLRQLTSDSNANNNMLILFMMVIKLARHWTFVFPKGCIVVFVFLGK